MLAEKLKNCWDRNKNEATAYPYWLIIDPAKVPLCNYKLRSHYISAAITGPFFSRETATAHLVAASHHFSKHAIVFCASGHASSDWKDLLSEAKEASACEIEAHGRRKEF